MVWKLILFNFARNIFLELNRRVRSLLKSTTVENSYLSLYRDQIKTNEDALER